uniref:Integrator complex subunit 4/Protein SIEL C-terminal Ig-like domain-containing protein n=1 Tax=Kalanchoe fedtschenkoi TaxID=63787 RepID=A0A7N0VIA1_KALFE
MENLIGSGSTEPSRFIVELRESASNMGSLVGDVSACQMVFKSLPKLFCLKPLTLCTRFKLLKAELDVSGGHPENPLPFVAGLPVGVPLNITLYNISSQINLWVKMKRDDEIIEFVYLDQNQFGHRSDVTNLMSTVPFYNTPRAISFVLKVSIGMECFHEKNIYEVKKLVRGPKYDLAFLCQDVEIHFSSGNNR